MANTNLFPDEAGFSRRPAWQVIEAARRQYLSGELTLPTKPATNIFMRDGIVYFAERSSDGTLPIRLMLEGVITREQMQRGTVIVNGVEHVGRMFDADPTIDRPSVELCTELFTDDVMVDVANVPVDGYEMALYRRHPSGIDRWYPHSLPIMAHHDESHAVDPVTTQVPQAAPAPTAVAEPKPVVQVEPKPVVQAQPKPVVQAQPKPVVQVEPKPVVQAQPKPVVQVEPKPVVQAQPKPVVQAEPKNKLNAPPITQAVPVTMPVRSTAPLAPPITQTIPLTPPITQTIPLTPPITQTVPVTPPITASVPVARMPAPTTMQIPVTPPTPSPAEIDAAAIADEVSEAIKRVFAGMGAGL